MDPVQLLRVLRCAKVDLGLGQKLAIMLLCSLASGEGSYNACYIILMRNNQL